jgi:hypothetical protein
MSADDYVRRLTEDASEDRRADTVEYSAARGCARGSRAIVAAA